VSHRIACRPTSAKTSKVEWVKGAQAWNTSTSTTTIELGERSVLPRRSPVHDGDECAPPGGNQFGSRVLPVSNFFLENGGLFQPADGRRHKLNVDAALTVIGDSVFSLLQAS